MLYNKRKTIVTKQTALLMPNAVCPFLSRLMVVGDPFTLVVDDDTLWKTQVQVFGYGLN